MKNLLIELWGSENSYDSAIAGCAGLYLIFSGTSYLMGSDAVTGIGVGFVGVGLLFLISSFGIYKDRLWGWLGAMLAFAIPLTFYIFVGRSIPVFVSLLGLVYAGWKAYAILDRGTSPSE